jgi:hypothetical protein
MLDDGGIDSDNGFFDTTQIEAKGIAKGLGIS